MRLAGPAEDDVLGDDAPIPAVAQAVELDLHALRAQLGAEMLLEKIRQPDLVQPDDGDDGGQDEEQHSDAEPAEEAAGERPETAWCGAWHNFYFCGGMLNSRRISG